MSILPPDFLKLTAFRARSFVCGTRVHGRSGKLEPNFDSFAAEHLRHPLVQRSVREGWDRDLRAHLIFAVRKAMLQELPHDDIGRFMPDAEWIRAAANNARRYAEASAWQKQMAEEHGSFDNFLQKTARGYVARSQPNAGSSVRRVLTETSRRMTADQDDLNT